MSKKGTKDTLPLLSLWVGVIKRATVSHVFYGLPSISKGSRSEMEEKCKLYNGECDIACHYFQLWINKLH